MPYKSWFEDFREPDSPESMAKQVAEAKADEAEWRANGKPLTNEDQIMHVYAYQCQEKELFALGEHIIQNHPDPADAWWLAQSVYQYYGIYYMMVGKPASAAHWLLKSIENGKPFPYPTYLTLAAAYAECDDIEQADHWLKLYMDNERKEGGTLSTTDWVNIAKYYYDTHRYAWALDLLLEIKEVQCKGDLYGLVLARTYHKLGEIEKCIATYEQHLVHHKYDAQAFGELALAIYEGYHDAEQSEAYYLKSIEYSAANWIEHKSWDSDVYRNLSIMFANEGNWEKCFGYLKKRFLTKYPPNEAAVMVEMIETLPAIESDEMGAELYHVITAFEAGHLRPTSDRFTEEKTPENPNDEVKDAIQGKSDLSGLMNLGDASAN